MSISVLAIKETLLTPTRLTTSVDSIANQVTHYLITRLSIIHVNLLTKLHNGETKLSVSHKYDNEPKKKISENFFFKFDDRLAFYRHFG